MTTPAVIPACFKLESIVHSVYLTTELRPATGGWFKPQAVDP
jgi:hypothetical protein